MTAAELFVIELVLVLVGTAGLAGASGALRLTRSWEGIATRLRWRLGVPGAALLGLASLLPLVAPMPVGPMRHHLALTALACLLAGLADARGRLGRALGTWESRALDGARVVWGGLALAAGVASTLAVGGRIERPFGPHFLLLWLGGVAVAAGLRVAVRRSRRSG